MGSALGAQSPSMGDPPWNSLVKSEESYATLGFEVPRVPRRDDVDNLMMSRQSELPEELLEWSRGSGRAQLRELLRFLLHRRFPVAADLKAFLGDNGYEDFVRRFSETDLRQLENALLNENDLVELLGSIHSADPDGTIKCFRLYKQDFSSVSSYRISTKSTQKQFVQYLAESDPLTRSALRLDQDNGPLSRNRVEEIIERIRAKYDGNEMQAIPLFYRELARNFVVVISGHMGYGKSLITRRVAAEFATEWIQCLSRNQESLVFMPIYIKCANVLRSDNFSDISSFTRRALHEYSLKLRLGLSVDDSAFDAPGEEHLVLYILDGLDESIFTKAQIEQFIFNVMGWSSNHRKFLITSRPAVLPEEHLTKYKIPMLKLQPFFAEEESSYAEKWLSVWPSGTPSPRSSDHDFWIVELYEHICAAFARGKHPSDSDRVHKLIDESSRHLLNAYRKTGDLSNREKESDAMLFFMSCLAWNAHCSSQQVTQEQLIYDSYSDENIRSAIPESIQGEHAEFVLLGVKLAMQAYAVNGEIRVFPGDPKIHEYLFASYWNSQICRLINQRSSHDRKSLEQTLLKGRILRDGDGAIRSLCIMLCKSTNAEFRRQLEKWTEECFHDEAQISQSTTMMEHSETLCISTRNDRRAPLREAALALRSLIACRLSRPGLEVTRPDSLRSVLAWFWLHNEIPVIRAMKVEHRNARLAGANLFAADFRNSNLTGADLSDVNLTQANLSESKLTSATLTNANLRNANLSKADLTAAVLVGAILADANLTDCDLTDADLTGADLTNSVLAGAILAGAKLGRANLTGADLRQADLADAIGLGDAILKGAKLPETWLVR